MIYYVFTLKKQRNVQICRDPALLLYFLIILLCSGGFPSIIDSGERWLTVESESKVITNLASCASSSVNLIRNRIAIHLGFTSLRANQVHEQHLKLFSNCL